MDEGMDSGDIIKINEIPITNNDNVGTLHDKLSSLGVTTLKEVLPKYLMVLLNLTNNQIHLL